MLRRGRYASAVTLAVAMTLTGCSGGRTPATGIPPTTPATTAGSAPQAAPGTGDVVPVPAGDLCQLLTDSDKTTLKIVGAGNTATAQAIPPTNSQTTQPAGAVAVGCTWQVANANDPLAGTISIIFISAATYQHDQQVDPTSATMPPDTPNGALVLNGGTTVEASANGFYFDVIGLSDPHDQEPGTAAALVIPHLSTAG